MSQNQLKSIDQLIRENKIQFTTTELDSISEELTNNPVIDKNLIVGLVYLLYKEGIKLRDEIEKSSNNVNQSTIENNSSSVNQQSIINELNIKIADLENKLLSLDSIKKSNQEFLQKYNEANLKLNQFISKDGNLRNDRDNFYNYLIDILVDVCNCLNLDQNKLPQVDQNEQDSDFKKLNQIEIFVLSILDTLKLKLNKQQK